MFVTEFVNESREMLENQLRSMCLEYAETIDVGELVEKGYTIEREESNLFLGGQFIVYKLLRHCEPIAYIIEKFEMNKDNSGFTIKISDVKRWENEYTL